MPTQEEIRTAIEALGKALGVGAEYVWEALYRQVYLVDGWLTLCLGLFLMLLGVVAVTRVALPVLKEEKQQKYATLEDDYSLSQFARIITGAAVGAGLAFAGAMASCGAIARIINPAYYAIKEVAGLF